MDSSYRALAKELKNGRSVWRITAISGENIGKAEQKDGNTAIFLQGLERVPGMVQGDGGTLLVERLTHDKTLLICGGGHVSVPIARLGKLLGYRVLVLDDRPEFADPARFPDADEVGCRPFEELGELDWEEMADVSVVIVTRGHAADLVCLRETLKHNTTYVGMIGSKKKNAAVFDVLRGEGVAETDLARVHAPIGLSIGAETPEEIAVCIAAELIAERRTSANSQLSDGILQALLDGKTGIMATIVRKSGSAPRGVGARLFVTEAGHALGTVGGGLAEGEVIETARTLLKQPRAMLKHFDMRNGEAGRSGLICGGEIDVLFEVVD